MMTRNTQLGSMSVLVHLVIVELSRVRHPDMATCGRSRRNGLECWKITFNASMLSVELTENSMKCLRLIQGRPVHTCAHTHTYAHTYTQTCTHAYVHAHTRTLGLRN